MVELMKSLLAGQIESARIEARQGGIMAGIALGGPIENELVLLKRSMFQLA